MAIVLGKDCAVSVGGAITSARNVSFSAAARTIDLDPFGSRENAVYSVGYDSTVTVEFNDAANATALFSALKYGTLMSVTGGAGAWTFDAIITSISESDPIDGVATLSVEAKLTRTGLR